MGKEADDVEERGKEVEEEEGRGRARGERRRRMEGEKAAVEDGGEKSKGRMEEGEREEEECGVMGR